MEFLNDLLDLNPNIAKGIPAKELCLAYISKPQPRTIFSELLTDTKGINCLNTLLDKNPNLARGITAEALCLITNPLTNISVLYLLSTQIEGRKFLNTLLSKNPDIIRGITAEVLCLSLPESQPVARTPHLYTGLQQTHMMA